MSKQKNIESESIPFESVTGPSHKVTGRVWVLEYQDTGISALPGMIETQFQIASASEDPLLDYRLVNVQLDLVEDCKTPRVVHKTSYGGFSASLIFKASPRIFIPLKKSEPLVLRIEWRLEFAHSGSGRDKVLKIFGKWNPASIKQSTLTDLESDL
ncbi:MAG: hypothetical protein AAF664_17750 [Planctomycetota bacterium]